MSSMPTPDPVFRAELMRLVDGDTMVVSLDRWLGDRSTKTLRLLGVDAPETRGPSREAGVAAREWVHDWLVSAFDIPYALTVQTAKYDSFGRVLARVWRTYDGAELSEALLESGHAVARSAMVQIAEAGER